MQLEACILEATLSSGIGAAESFDDITLITVIGNEDTKITPLRAHPNNYVT